MICDILKLRHTSFGLVDEKAWALREGSNAWENASG